MPQSFLKSYLNELSVVIKNIRPEEFCALIDEFLAAYERDSYIFVFGNGGSGSTASHFACDINKGVSYGKNKRFKVISLNDNIPTIMAYANDVSYDAVFVEQLKNFLSRDDLVIGISGSGNSINIIKAIEYANSQGGKTFGLCGYNGGTLRKVSQKSLTIECTDMQKVEDAHVIIIHSVMQYLQTKLPVI
jgi:D-sedoheptulose 7-phosphate isomerase